MSVRERQHFRFGRRPAPESPSLPEQRSEETLLLGFPAEFADDEARDADVPSRAEVLTDPRLGVLRRADRLAGGALILAGVAAAVSLTFPWFRGGERDLVLVHRLLRRRHVARRCRRRARCPGRPEGGAHDTADRPPRDAALVDRSTVR